MIKKKKIIRNQMLGKLREEVMNKAQGNEEVKAKAKGNKEVKSKAQRDEGAKYKAQGNEEVMNKAQGNEELRRKEKVGGPLQKEEKLPVKKETTCLKTDDTLKIREQPPKIADSLFLQLEEEIVGFINSRLENHTAKRIKGILLPVAKLSLKMKKLRHNFMKAQGEYFSDLEDDLDYILENSKLKRISPRVGEKFRPDLHEEVDFSWDPNHGESEIIASLRDGFFWEYNSEMILKPQVVVNRRV